MRLGMFQEQMQREPTRFAGGGSPYVAGLQLEEYKKLSPALISDFANPQNVTHTDIGDDLEKIVGLSEEWTKAIQKAVDTGKFEYPLICPPVIGDGIYRIYFEDGDEFNDYLEGEILDGNNRVGAAALHTEKMPAFFISEGCDLEAIAKLAETEHFYWPHMERESNELVKLNALAKNASNHVSNYENIRFNDFAFDVLQNTSIGEKDELSNHSYGFYFNHDIFSDSSLKYCIGKVAFQDQLGEPTTQNAFVMPQYLKDKENIPRSNLQEEIQNHNLRERLKEIISSSGIRDRNIKELIDGTIDFLYCGATISD